MKQCGIIPLTEVSAFVIKTLFLSLEEPAIQKVLCHAPMHKIHVFITGEKNPAKFSTKAGA